MRVNKAELARIFGVSEPTVSKWIADGVPIETKGDNGVAYEFDPEKVKAWKDEREERARQAEADREREISRMQSELFGADQQLAPEGLSQDDIGKYLANVRSAEALKVQMGQRLDRADVENEFAAVFNVLRQRMLGWSSTLAKLANLTPEQQNLAEGLVRDTMAAMHRQLKDPGLQAATQDAAA